MVLIAIPGKSRYIAWVLLADFCIFVGFDEIWLASSIPGGDWMLPYKAFLYIAFFLLYMLVGSLTLSIMSGLAAIYHSTATILEPMGIIIPYEYSDIMTWYCIAQLLVGYIGVLYGYARRYSPYRHRRGHHHSSY